MSEGGKNIAVAPTLIYNDILHLVLKVIRWPDLIRRLSIPTPYRRITIRPVGIRTCITNSTKTLDFLELSMRGTVVARAVLDMSARRGSSIAVSR